MQNIPYQGKRVETGALKIGEDWAGIFIRGDDAAGMSRKLKWIATNSKDERIKKYLLSLCDLLDQCYEGD